MEGTKYRINLDVQQGGVQQTLMGFRVGDALSRTVSIHLVERGAAYQVPTGCVVTLYAQKPDGTVSYSLCSVEDGAVEHTFTSGELAAAGEMLCEVRITTGGETPVVLSSPQFGVIVENVLQDDDAIASTNEYSALTQAIAEMEDVCEAAETATQSANTAAGAAQTAAQAANTAAGTAQTAAQAANSAVEGMQEQFAEKPTSYVLYWTNAQYEEYQGVMAQNEPVLEELYAAEEGSYHLVLKDGDKEFAMSRREYTSAGRYEFCFPTEINSSFAPYEYIVWYKPATVVDAAECGLNSRSVVNNENIVEYDFRPPTTDLVRVCMDLHEENTDIHITAAERSKWDAGCVTYTLSKTGATIKLAGSDGTEQTVTDANTTYGAATTSTAGLMSAADKGKLDGITESADSVVFTASLTSGTEVGTLTINGTETKLWAPTNTHYTSETVVANTATSQADAAATNGNVYLNHVESGVVRSSHKITGSGATTVTSDSSGNITIQSTNTTYGTATTSTAGLMSTADKGKLDGIAEGANNYAHPTYTSKTSGLYKITVNGQGHVSAATAVTKSDITPLLDMDAIIAAFPDASEVNY